MLAGVRVMSVGLIASYLFHVLFRGDDLFDCLYDALLSLALLQRHIYLRHTRELPPAHPWIFS